MWAPDISEHQGRFFIYYPQDGKLFVVHADKPSGPWSEPVDLQQGGIDPCHVVAPDGTRYLYYGGADVRQLSADGLSLVGEQQHVHDGWKYPDSWKTAGFWMESPKGSRRGEFYYPINAQGGTDGPPASHMAVVARSPSPLGPWENPPYNPLIHTYSADEDWWSVGHGTLVSTPDDRWYFVYHGYRKNFWTLGRWLARAEGGDWQSLVEDVDVSGYIHNNLRGFQALRPALFASGAGSAQFSDFVYRAVKTRSERVK